MWPEFILAVVIAMVQDALIVVFNRSINKDRMIITMFMTACLAALSSLTTLLLVQDSMFAYANIIGSVLGIPVGMKIPIAHAVSPKPDPTRPIGFRSSDPS